MKLRKTALWMLLAGLLLLVAGMATPIVLTIVFTSRNGSIGIIGGADGPTLIFLLNMMLCGWPFCCILCAVALFGMALFCLLLPCTVELYCGARTTGLCFGISAAIGVGIVCAFICYGNTTGGEMAMQPLALLFSIVLGIAALAAAAALAVIYGDPGKIDGLPKAF